MLYKQSINKIGKIDCVNIIKHRIVRKNRCLLTVWSCTKIS